MLGNTLKLSGKVREKQGILFPDNTVWRRLPWNDAVLDACMEGVFHLMLLFLCTGLLLLWLWFRDGAGNTVEENCIVLSVIRMHSTSCHQ